MTQEELMKKTSETVRNVFRHYYEIHRPLIVGRGGVGSDAYAEANGNLNVACSRVNTAKAVSLEKWSEEGCTPDLAEQAVINVLSDILNKAREDELILLHDGSRSATVVRACLISGLA